MRDGLGNTLLRTLRRPGVRPLFLLVVLFALQAWWSQQLPRAWQPDRSPGMAPTLATSNVFSLGERAAAAYAAIFYVQTFDTQAGASLQIRTLDQAALRSWLDAALDLQPRSAYPLLLAARVYAEAANPADAREMLRLVDRRFRQAPDERWAWQAHAVFVARHVLHDMAFARELARGLREHTGPAVPAWARQAEIFLLADSDELQAARALLGGLIESGRVRDEGERSFLLGRLTELDARLSSDRRAQSTGRKADISP